MKTMTRDDFWRHMLELRRLWFEVNAGANTCLLSDVDLTVLSAFCQCARVSDIEVEDSGLAFTLETVLGNQEINKNVFRISPWDSFVGENGEDCVRLISLSKLIDIIDLSESVRHRSTLATLVYGWSEGWCPSASPMKGWPKDILFLPMSNLSPVLWRSNVQVMTIHDRREQVGKYLKALSGLFNDSDLDLLMLLDRIQVLETAARGRSAERLRRSGKQPSDGGEVQRLMGELHDARRTIALQNSMLATAYKALGG